MLNLNQNFSLTCNGEDLAIYRPAGFEAEAVNFASAIFKSKQKLNFVLTASQPIGHFTISPALAARVEGNHLLFELNSPRYLMIQLENQEPVFIFVDRVKPKPAHTRIINVGKIFADSEAYTALINELLREAEPGDLLYFPPGHYDCDEIILQSGVSVYLAAGAVIQAISRNGFYSHAALLYGKDLSDVQISGLGLLDGNGRLTHGGTLSNLIKLEGCTDVLVNGLTEVDSPFWANHVKNCRQVEFRNFKVVNYRPASGVANTDGLNFDTCQDCSLTHGFFYTGDDCCTVKGTVVDGESRHISFQEVLCLSNSAACKIGTETQNRLMQDIEFKDFTVVACDRVAAICGYDQAAIRQVNFRNFIVEHLVPAGVGAEPSRLFDFEITDKAWRPCAGQCTIRDVSCTNFQFAADCAAFPSLISGHKAEFALSDLSFKNISPKINLETNEFVSGLVYEH